MLADVITTKMLGRGFVPINETCDEISHLGSFIYDGRKRVHGYECVVNYDTQEFRFTAAIPFSTTRLETPWTKKILFDKPFEAARSDFETSIFALEKNIFKEKRKRHD